jgi:hypothetical protein
LLVGVFFQQGAKMKPAKAKARAKANPKPRPEREPIMLIGNTERHNGTVKQNCKDCGIDLWVQTENVPLVEASKGAYICTGCATLVEDAHYAGLLHHGKLMENPTVQDLSHLIDELLKKEVN